MRARWRGMERKAKMSADNQTPTDMIVVANEGTPCPCSGRCCEAPDTYCPPHECDAEDICEGCFVSECKNCGGYCACDL
jgi:hypothetical protein